MIRYPYSLFMGFSRLKSSSDEKICRNERKLKKTNCKHITTKCNFVPKNEKFRSLFTEIENNAIKKP